MKYRKKPVVINALQFDGSKESVDQVIALAANPKVAHAIEVLGDPPQLLIPTLEGLMRADPGDFLICGVKGELYPCKPDIFDATYEPVQETEPAV